MSLAGMADELARPPKIALVAARRDRTVFIISFIISAMLGLNECGVNKH